MYFNFMEASCVNLCEIDYNSKSPTTIWSVLYDSLYMDFVFFLKLFIFATNNDTTLKYHLKRYEKREWVKL